MSEHNLLADLNEVRLRGTLSAPVEIKNYPSGGTSAHLLVTVRTEDPVMRVDVLPVVLWEPYDHDDFDPDEAQVGDTVDLVAQVRRRFWAAEDGRRSRLELVAKSVKVTPPNDVIVIYSTEVIVQMTNGGEVKSVKVDDQLERVRVIDAETLGEVDEERALAAYRQADRAEWPSWDRV